MFQVNLGNKILYYPGSDDAMIYDTELNEELGIAGEFTFKVPPQNPLYSEITTGELVTIYKDGEEFWRGDIRDIKIDFANVANVYCLEDLAWLGDEYMTPASIDNETYAQRFSAAISAYNTNRSGDRLFTAGYVTNVTSSNTCIWKTEYEWSILDSLRACICQDNGYIRVRRVTNSGVVTRYIDIVKLSDYGVQATQPIQYGYNLLDYVKESDYGNLTNVLTPYGDELETEAYDEYPARLAGTTITEATSVAAYGRHAKAVIFDGVTDLATLNSLAAAYLTRYCQPQLTMEVKAVDLAEIENVDDIKLGDSVRIVAEPYAIDQWLYLTQIRRDLQNLEKNNIVLSGNVQGKRTITSQTISTSEALKNLPTKASVLDAAKKNAIEILNGVDGGYVTFVTNSSDQITELRIANNIDFDQATKAWRWNVSGLAYMSRTTVNDDWTIGVAATMDGGIVADFITTGFMLADRIKGGTLSLGGYNNQGGIFSIFNASNVEKVHGDNTGIKVGGTVGSRIHIATDGIIEYDYDNAYSGELAMDAVNYGTQEDPDLRDTFVVRRFNDILLTSDDEYAELLISTNESTHAGEIHLKAYTQNENPSEITINSAGVTFNGDIKPDSSTTGQNIVLYMVGSDFKSRELIFQKGILTSIQQTIDIPHYKWHTWEVSDVMYDAIVLGVGVTQAVFPDIDSDNAYDPYIQVADGESPPKITDTVKSGTSMTVSFTAITSAQAAGNACVIKLMEYIF